jgi:predicted enzyme related to lactoylglutathione lyase
VARLIGFNHVAVEVDDIEEALAFFSRIFDFELRGRAPRMAFIDAGDQFLAISEGRTQSPDEHRHIGLVVDDRTGMREAVEEAGGELLAGRGLDFRDPWGNYWQVVEYGSVQFTKSPEVLLGMNLEGLEKTDEAMEQLRKKGMPPT